MTLHGYQEVVDRYQKRIDQFHLKVDQMALRLALMSHPLFQKRENDRLAYHRSIMFMIAAPMILATAAFVVYKLFR